MPACICVSKFNCGVSPIILKSFGDRLSLGGMAPKAVIGAVMRKLVQLIYGVIESGQPFDMQKAMPKLDLQDGI